MDIPLRVFFRYMPRDNDLVNIMCQKASELERIFKHIIACRVHLEKNQKRGEPGGLYSMRLEVLLPQRHEIVVKKSSKTTPGFTKLSPLITDTFDIAARELEEIKEKKYGHRSRKAGE